MATTEKLRNIIKSHLQLWGLADYDIIVDGLVKKIEKEKPPTPRATEGYTFNYEHDVRDMYGRASAENQRIRDEANRRRTKSSWKKTRF